MSFGWVTTVMAVTPSGDCCGSSTQPLHTTIVHNSYKAFKAVTVVTVMRDIPLPFPPSIGDPPMP